MLQKRTMNPVTEGRIQRAPLSACSFFLNILCIIGNTTVLHVFRTKYKKSNYRFFVLLLASFDMGTAIVFVIKEQFRIQRVYYGGTSITCQILNFLGHTIGIGTICIVLFIAVERYKKICTPFQTQFTIPQCVRVCAIAIIISALLNIPSIFIFGKRELNIDQLNGTRCCVLKKFDDTGVSILYFGSLNVVSLAVVICIIVIQMKIRAIISRQSRLKKKMKLPATIKTKPNITETSLSGEDGDIIDDEDKLQAKTIAVASIANLDFSKTNLTSDSSKAIKITIAFCIITALLIMSFQAMFTHEIILAVSRYYYPDDHISKSRDMFNVYFPDVVTLNGVLNPFVYFFVDNRFRHEVRKLFRR